jgi:hypothetical protein
MTDVFISYASEDRADAERLASVLSDRGWDVWWDRRLVAGSLFDEVIEERLDEARAVIVVWSTTAVASEWVRAEATAAIERGVIIPVLIEPCRVPLRFRNVQTIDLSDWDGDPTDSRLRELQAAIGAVTAGHPPAPTAPHERVEPDRPTDAISEPPPAQAPNTTDRPRARFRWWQIAAAVVAVSIIGVAVVALTRSDGDTSAPSERERSTATAVGDAETSETAEPSPTPDTDDDGADPGRDAPIGRTDGLDTGEWLYADDERRSADGRWVLLLQADGNLVVEDEQNPDDGPIWASGTSGVPGARAVMQPDGNFVILDYSTGENEGPVYSTGTAGNPGATLTIQNDGAVVIRSRSGAQLFNSSVDATTG